MAFDIFLCCGAQKKTLDPIWNETFEFRVSYEKMVGHNLVFFVYDWDPSGNNRVIGAAEIAIAEVDFRAPIMQAWLPIKKTAYEKVCLESFEYQ